MTHSGRTTKRRRALLKKSRVCHYCGRETDTAVKQLYPTVEHFIPRHFEKQLGERRIVLACHWCDKTKSLLTGDEYLIILNEEQAKAAKFETAQVYVTKRCKKLMLEKYRELRLQENKEKEIA